MGRASLAPTSGRVPAAPTKNRRVACACGSPDKDLRPIPTGSPACHIAPRSWDLSASLDVLIYPSSTNTTRYGPDFRIAPHSFPLATRIPIRPQSVTDPQSQAVSFRLFPRDTVYWIIRSLERTRILSGDSPVRPLRHMAFSQPKSFKDRYLSRRCLIWSAQAIDRKLRTPPGWPAALMPRSIAASALRSHGQGPFDW
jgi:hypothetical protein